MKQIPLCRRDGSVREWALVDDEDYEWLMQWRWCYLPPNGHNKTGYAIRTDCREGRRKTIRMHRLILGEDLYVDVDHWNRNGLDNQRSNLRPCSNSQNQGNQGINLKNKSGYKGVSWHKQVNKWRADIGNGGKKTYLGCFSSVEDAARAYDKAASEKWGKFACLNFPAVSGSAMA